MILKIDLCSIVIMVLFLGYDSYILVRVEIL